MGKETALKSRNFTIGALSKKAGVNIETIRYYERIGVMPPPPRSVGGYRLYGPDDVKRLNFVRRCRELGFTLEKIRVLLRLVGAHNYTCDDIKAITKEQLGMVRGKITDLKKLEKALNSMVARCNGGKLPDCPIIDALNE